MEVRLLKKVIIISWLIYTLIFSVEVKAEFKVPISKETAHWKVQLIEPPKYLPKDANVHGKNGIFEVYKLLVTYKGETAYKVFVGAFRSETGTDKMFGLAPQLNRDILKKGEDIGFENFPVKVETEKLEIMIIWEDEPTMSANGDLLPGRKYKETILFTP
jgi:hypothetical protein